MCQLLTLYPFFVGFGVGADGLPLFLFPGRVSWHGGVLGVLMACALTLSGSDGLFLEGLAMPWLGLLVFL